MIKRLLLSSLTICSLAACSNTELIHSDVGCLSQPQVSMNLTNEEAGTISDSAKKKIVIFAKTLRARIDAQCEINRSHDAQYDEK